MNADCQSFPNVDNSNWLRLVDIAYKIGYTYAFLKGSYGPTKVAIHKAVNAPSGQNKQFVTDLLEPIREFANESVGIRDTLEGFLEDELTDDLRKKLEFLKDRNNNCKNQLDELIRLSHGG